MTLPAALGTTSTGSPFFQTYLAAQVAGGARGFLSKIDSMAMVDKQTHTGTLVLGEIVQSEDLQRNLSENAVPSFVREVTTASYREFLGERRRLMAASIRRYYEAL